MSRFALLLLLGACATDDGAAITDVEDPSTVDPQLALYCPGHSRAAGITTYRGLAGNYLRFGLLADGEPTQLRLTTAHDDPDADGDFTGTWAGALGQLPQAKTGKFRAIPDNPAIGAAMSFDFGGDDVWDQSYFVLGVKRSLTGKVSSLCLVGGKTPFMMSRSLF